MSGERNIGDQSGGGQPNSPGHPEKKGRIGLILTRRIDQAVVIDHDTEFPIVVRILGVERDRVKIGISADENNHHVLREELLKKGKSRAEHATGASETVIDPKNTGPSPNIDNPAS